MTEGRPAGAVLLDLDGTLLDTPRAIVETMTRVCAELAVRLDAAEFSRTVGRPLAPAVADCIGRPLGSAEVDRVVRAYRARFLTEVVPRGLVFPGVPEMLRGARAAGLGTAVVTNKTAATGAALLTGSGLADLVEVAVYADGVPRPKPHPDMARLALRRLGLSAGPAVVVGDHVDDMRMAVAAGLPPVGVRTGVSAAADLTLAGATVIVPTAADLGATEAYRNLLVR